ncbi:MAG: CHAT domain-containing tetratricopeptide repeat protein, partial [Planctomycetota bacterium]
EPLFVEAKEITEDTLGVDHPDYAISLNNLAELYRVMGKLDQAVVYSLEAQAIVEKKVGRRHRTYALSLNNLALLRYSMGDFNEAESLYRDALSIFEAVLGRDHPSYTRCSNNLASLYFTQGDFKKANAIFAAVLDTTTAHLESTAEALSESEQIAMASSLRYQLQNQFNCVFDGKLPADGVVGQRLRWKGSALLRARAARLAASDPIVAGRFQELRSLSSEYKSVLEKEPKNETESSVRRDELRRLSEQRRLLEKRISEVSATFRSSREPPTFEEIQRAIPDGGVLLDFIARKTADGNSQLAIVVPSDGAPTLIHLGSSQAISRSVDEWLEAIRTGRGSRDAGAALRRQVWDPLVRFLGEAKLILVSPDGPFCRMPFSALPGEDRDSYLIKEYSCVYIPVPRLLPEIILNSEERSSIAVDRELLLIGGVDYDATVSEGTTSPVKQATASESDQRAAMREQRVRYDPLPGTASEAESIQRLLLAKSQDAAIEYLSGSEATESQFRRLAPASRHLHIATHGYFAHSVASLDRKETAGSETGGSSSAADDARSLRAGLALSGANAVQAGKAKDGILTAEEISFLPMNRVDLAVLSACETVLGEAAGGEGLFGMQRAFQVAGV